MFTNFLLQIYYKADKILQGIVNNYKFYYKELLENVFIMIADYKSVKILLNMILNGKDFWLDFQSEDQ